MQVKRASTQPCNGQWRKHPAHLLPQGCVSNFLFPQVQWIATPSAHSAPPCRPPPPSPSTLSPSTPPWYSTAGRTLSFPFPGFVCGQPQLRRSDLYKSSPFSSSDKLSRPESIEVINKTTSIKVDFTDIFIEDVAGRMVEYDNWRKRLILLVETMKSMI